MTHLLSDIGPALKHGEHVGVDSIFLEDIADDLRAGDGDKRGSRCTLPGDSVSADECDGCVPCEDCVGEIESSDDANCAKRVPYLHHEVLLSLGVEDLPSDCSRKSAGHVAHVNRLLHFSQSLRKNLAHLQGDQLAQWLFLGPESLADLPHDVSSDWHWHRSPFFLSLTHPGNGILVIDQAGGLSLRNHLLIRRIDGLEDLRGGVCLPLAIVICALVVLLESKLSEEGILGVGAEVQRGAQQLEH